MASSTLPTIGMLWIGDRVSWLEQLCMQSFLDVGHDVVLFCYDPVANVPSGVTIADANEIYPSTDFIRHARTGSPAIHADVFRLHLMQKTEMIWADTDAYCLRPWSLPPSGHFHAPVQEDLPLIANGVLRLPKTSAALAQLFDFFADPYPIPAWFPETQQEDLRTKKARGEGVHISLLPWGTTGPQLLTHALQSTGEVQHTLPFHILYPLPFSNTHWFFRAIRPHQKARVEGLIKDDTVSIHFYGRRFRDVARNFHGVPEPQSYIGDLLTKHGIDWRPSSYKMAGHYKHNTPVIAPLPDIDFSSVPQTACHDLAISDVTLSEDAKRAWRAGAPAVKHVETIHTFAERRRDIILQRSFQDARKRCEAFVDVLDPYRPKRIARIGATCGFEELHLYRRYKCHLTLIGDQRAKDSKEFLVANGVPGSSIKIIGPTEARKSSAKPFDVMLAFSDPAHKRQPVARLTPWVEHRMNTGSILVTDIRPQTGGYPQLRKFGVVRTLASHTTGALVAVRIGAEGFDDGGEDNNYDDS